MYRDDLELAVRVRDLVKTYGEGRTEVQALRGVSLDVPRGEFLAIMGPSGSGKSTLLHILGALDAPTAGTIEVAGNHYEGFDDAGLTRIRRDHIGFVFQFFNLLPSLTAAENVLLPALIARSNDAAMRDRVMTLLERVGLRDRADHLPSELSGGQQQRVSIARALLLDPELVLADEPTGNLDRRSSREILSLLRTLAGDDHTIVTVTHDPMAAEVADRVVFLRDGLMAGEVEGGSIQRAIDFAASLETKDEQWSGASTVLPSGS
jgi:putative ABC transport system ATP-binding protein